MNFKISYEARNASTTTPAEFVVAFDGDLTGEEAYVTVHEFALKDSLRFHHSGQGAIKVIRVEQIAG